MTDFQDAKALVRAYQTALAGAAPDTVGAALAQHMAPDCAWHGMHPFHEQVGPAAIAQVFWTPLLHSLTALQRREDMFFAGANDIDHGASTWVASMGHFMGLFDAPFLNIPATGKIAMLRYAEFHKVEGGKITQSALFVDLLHLMTQAGIKRFPNQTAEFLVQPGPRTHDGVLDGPQDAAESAKTLRVINQMIGAIDDANVNPVALTRRQEMELNWHEDMIWWGPEGIGATFTIDRYIQQHQRPFRENFADRAFNGHICRMAEGNFGGFFGWPNLTLTNEKAFMGVPGSDKRVDMRVVDFYRRDGDKLAENWIFIDMLHFLNMQGVDVLGELAAG